eukprot:COSAG02_NODE_2490_length_8694_cov_3.602909_6_plen_97_part_00
MMPIRPPPAVAVDDALAPVMAKLVLAAAAETDELTAALTAVSLLDVPLLHITRDRRPPVPVRHVSSRAYARCAQVHGACYQYGVQQAYQIGGEQMA